VQTCFTRDPEGVQLFDLLYTGPRRGPVIWPAFCVRHWCGTWNSSEDVAQKREILNKTWFRNTTVIESWAPCLRKGNEAAQDRPFWFIVTWIFFVQHCKRMLWCLRWELSEESVCGRYNTPKTVFFNNMRSGGSGEAKRIYFRVLFGWEWMWATHSIVKSDVKEIVRQLTSNQNAWVVKPLGKNVIGGPVTGRPAPLDFFCCVWAIFLDGRVLMTFRWRVVPDT
jgi:hypothetical protein